MKESTTLLVIPVHKTKVVLLLLACLCFIAACVWMWTRAEEQTRRSPIFMKVIAAAGLLFFSVAFVFGITVILRKRYGLIIDDKGITDNTTIFSERFIPWTDIIGLGEMRIKRTRILLLRVKDPQVFIDRESGFRRSLLLQSNRSYGTPLSLTTNILKVDVDELKAIIYKRIEMVPD